MKTPSTPITTTTTTDTPHLSGMAKFKTNVKKVFDAIVRMQTKL